MSRMKGHKGWPQYGVPDPDRKRWPKLDPWEGKGGGAGISQACGSDSQEQKIRRGRPLRDSLCSLDFASLRAVLGCLAKFEFQTNDECFFSISAS